MPCQPSSATSSRSPRIDFTGYLKIASTCPTSMAGILAFLCRLGIPRDRCFHQRLEGARVHRFAFGNVDRPPGGAFETGIEKPRWIRDRRAAGESELHDLLVCLTGADYPVVRPDRNVPLPLFGHLRVGVQDQRPHASERVAAPAAELADPLVDEPAGRFFLR